MLDKYKIMTIKTIQAVVYKHYDVDIDNKRSKGRIKARHMMVGIVMANMEDVTYEDVASLLGTTKYSARHSVTKFDESMDLTWYAKMANKLYKEAMEEINDFKGRLLGIA